MGLGSLWKKLEASLLNTHSRTYFVLDLFESSSALTLMFCCEFDHEKNRRSSSYYARTDSEYRVESPYVSLKSLFSNCSGSEIGVMILKDRLS